ncbi:MAG: nucleotidyltransferase family protein [Hyphomicrobium sp.]|uniref:nucleotidyltransferase family protein n=1 Tax=Hyphomicrobium sp. TaxID=82 RepID=UPI0039E71B06
MFIPQHFSAARRFPHLSWTWPSGDRNALLIAAGHRDEHRAAASFVDWQLRADFDKVEFAEQRLLVTATNRFPATRLTVPNRARLDGLVRMFWTRSRLSLNQAAPALRALRAAGVEILVLKGMAAVAHDLQNLKGRIAHDIDILIHTRDVPTALVTLDGQGWIPNRGESLLFLKEQGARFRSINFLKRPFGDIDLHTRACLTTSADSPAETGIWQRSTRAFLLDADVLVPCATDRLMTAIAHGALDANHHSDWLIDSARLIAEEKIDWQLLAALAEELSASAQLSSALFYLRDILDVEIPDQFLVPIWEQARKDSTAYFKALLLGYPRDKHSVLTGLGRRIFKLHHSAQINAANKKASAAVPKSDIRMHRISSGLAVAASPRGLRHRLVVGEDATKVKILIGVEGTDKPRRYLFEINTGHRHVTRLRYRDRCGAGSEIKLSAELSLPNDLARDDLWIELRQSGPLPSLHSEDEKMLFGPRPFSVSVSMR